MKAFPLSTSMRFASLLHWSRLVGGTLARKYNELKKARTLSGRPKGDGNTLEMISVPNLPVIHWIHSLLQLFSVC